MTAPDDPQRNPRVRLRALEILSDAWYTLKRATYDYQGSDGAWSEQRREVYDRGNGATILLRDETRDTVLLTRQFRMPAYLNGHPDGMLIEAPAGLLDDEDAETAIRREAEEETGYRVGVGRADRRVLHEPRLGDGAHRVLHRQLPRRASASPQGGGVEGEGEDIEVLEVTLAEALAMVERGEIVDGKTVLLLRLAQRA